MSLKPRKVDFHATWDLIKTILEGVITCGTVPKYTWKECFSDVYKLCTALPKSHSDALYSRTKDFLEEHVKRLEKEIIDSGEESILETYHKHWQSYNTGTSYLNRLYGYLNNTYIKKQKYSEADVTYGVFAVDADCLLEIGELAKEIWKKLMIDHLGTKLVNLVLQEIARDRGGYDVNSRVVHSVVTSFVDVSEYNKKTPHELYQHMFESVFLKETGDFYRHEAARLKADCSCSEYLEKVILRLDNEDLRSRKFLHVTSYSKVTCEVRTKMVAEIIDYLHSECTDMVEQERKTDMSNMYTLLKPIPKGLYVLVLKLESHIRHQGAEAVYSLENNPAFVEAMLKVHKKFKELISTVFNNDQVFKSALDKACSAVINERPNNTRNKSPQLLAKYCDNLLKKSMKGVGDAELDEKLSGCIVIFNYLDDKDVFHRFYSRLLAKRLIYGQSSSMDSEESMITRLKQACGFDFTYKLQRMFTDVSVSADLVKQFDDFLTNKDEKIAINFSILVCHSGAWPSENSMTFHLPQELEQSVGMFEGFYDKKFSGRKLTWMHNLSTVEVKLCYLKRTYSVTMSTFQMATLLPFERSDSHSFMDVKESTNLSLKELVKQLQPLVDSKILNCSETTVTENSAFTLNITYTNKRMKFKIKTPIQKESQQEIENTHAAADDDRKFYLQASIVRIMKARKKIKHNTLIEEVITQAHNRFTPSIYMIKKIIESLIDKEYLERVADTNDEYSYIA